MAKDKNNLKPRSPVVAVVGHVDHGKTALLDYIRKSNVVEGEAGGITQSIGAYELDHNGKKITFIDTPGHEAFTQMRAHGTSAADMAILVVAADESIKDQTKEALEILRATETPFIVAITKTDKENANLEKVKADLLSAEVFLEGSGGDVSWQGVSAKTGEGIDELLDLILLMGEVTELLYNPENEARGFVIEAQKDPRRGTVAHLIVKDGALRQGDQIKTASTSGKVKILEDFLGNSVKELLPSAPASVVGFDDIPASGEEFVTGDAKLEEKAEEVEKNAPAKEVDKESPQAVLKADTKGSLEALKGLLGKEVEIVEASVGDVTDNDVKLAVSTGGIIVGFRTKIDKSAANLAETQDINVFDSQIIYELLDSVKEYKKRERHEFEGGELEVLATFGSTPTKQTVGGVVKKGAMKINVPVDIERDGEILGKGRVKSLQSNKQDASQVGPDNEAGLVVETQVEIEKGDILKISL